VASVAETKSSASGTVTVAVKSPHGILLRVFRPQGVREPLPGGGYRDVTQHFEVPNTRHELFGWAHEKGKQPRVPVVLGADGISGYAMNHDVPADIWNAWLEQNHESDLVRNGLIFAYAKEGDARAHARDGENVWDGLHPMQVDEFDDAGKPLFKPDPRAPKGKFMVGRAKMSDVST
jgi:hypothetical protein